MSKSRYNVGDSLEEEHLVKSSIPYTPKSPGWGQRHKVALLGFFGFFNVYAMRVNLSIAAIKMAKEYEWCGEGGGNCTLKGTIMSSFFFGYIATQVFGGWFATKLGGKHVYGIGILMTSVLTLLTPRAARTGTPVLIALRIAEGFFEGVTYPAFHSILGRWVPMHERTKISTFVYAGAYAGTVVSQPLSGYLCEVNFLGGWPAVFYVCGSAGCLWYIMWILLFRSNPEFDPFISKEELAYIVDNRSEKLSNADPLEFNDEESGTPEETDTPWYSIMTSPAVWAIIVGHTVNNWGFYNLLVCLPQFMDKVLKYNLEDAGFIAAVPYVAMWFIAVVTGNIADYARSRGIKTVKVRKFCQALGQTISAITIVACGYVEGPHAKLLAVVAITLSVGAGGICLSGFNVNHLDIAPKYSGVLMGITNSAATIPGMIAPMITDSLTTASAKTDLPKLKEQWRTVFWITGGIYVFGIIFFTTFAAGEKQPWADGKRRRKISTIQ
eukprot:m.151631 g.151631  ORF g.151631 m.151631 type:complete len:496 (-) comp30770_c2_seq4:305-1792(-)